MTHVLVVDDDEGICKMPSEILSMEGYDVESTRDGQEGVSAVLNMAQPLIVIVDYMMPPPNGGEVLRLLAAAERPPVPLAFVLIGSELGVANMREAAAEASPPFTTLDLVKPFDVDTLLNVMDEAARLVGG